MSKLANVYAGALFEIAQESSETEEILQQSAQLLTIFNENPQFEKLLSAPIVEKEEKLALLDKVFAGRVNTHLLNYMKVMTQRKCALELSQSFLEYEKLYNQYNNIEKVTAITAVPLSEDMSSKLETKLKHITGKTILLKNKVDENCIGGVILELNDEQIDDSIQQKLNTLKLQLRSI